MFLVVYGRLRLQLQDGGVELHAGKFYVIPNNTLHNPLADQECGVVLIKTVITLHKGNVTTDRTKTFDQQLLATSTTDRCGLYAMSPMRPCPTLIAASDGHYVEPPDNLANSSGPGMATYSISVRIYGMAAR